MSRQHKSRRKEPWQKSRNYSRDHREDRRPPRPEPPSIDSILESRLGGERLARLAAESRSRLVELIAARPSRRASGALPVPSRQAPAVTVTSEPAPPQEDRGFARAQALRLWRQACAEARQQAPQAPAQPCAPLPEADSNGLDAWQEKALALLLEGRNLVVDAPTSAGKTRVVERLLDARIASGIKLVYTSPVKSLSNDKYREFSEKYGREKVGINTGDFKENLGAPIILATLETYRNSLLGVEPRMDRTVVVYDEYHYLQDEGRGSAWEESIVLTPAESQLVLLSASVPNAEDFAQWITSLKGKPCEVVRVTERPVPLMDVVYTKFGWILAETLALRPQLIQELREASKAVRDSEKRRFRLNPKERYLSLVAPVESALELGLGPVVVYAGRRADVENVAFTLARRMTTPMSASEASPLRERITTLSGWEYVPSDLQRLILKTGVAYHHSGMIPPGRVAIESLLKEGLLRVCSGTMGISLGVNFAVRSAVVSDESRPGEGGETRYSGTEVMQMLGRAGRRGKDTQGFSLWRDAGRFAVQKPEGREPCTSSLKFDPSTVLGILGQHENLAYLSEFYRKSFFMRGRDVAEVLVGDHDLLSSILYREHGIETLPCEDIPDAISWFDTARKRKAGTCEGCEHKGVCHPLFRRTQRSMLHKVVSHLWSIGALAGPKPTAYGQLARHFPQAGGLIVARWLASGQLHAGNLRDYAEAMACFCAAHHKDIPHSFGDADFIADLDLPELIATHYPRELFDELYDTQFDGTVVFREFNPAAGSIISLWLDEETTWDELVSAHETKNFSAGDCMMVLFRFATFLQSLARVESFSGEIAQEALRMRSLILRSPLDARNRMLLEDVEESAGEGVVAESEPEGS